MELAAAAALGKFIGAGLACIGMGGSAMGVGLSLIHISEPTRPY